MDTDETNTLRLLLGLYVSCRDGEERYRIASEGERDSDLKFLFSSYCRQRARFAGQLQELLCTEEQPSKGGGDSPLPDDEHSCRKLLQEFVRWEETLLTEYRKVLAAELSAPVRALVEAQCREIEAVCARMTELCRLEQAG